MFCHNCGSPLGPGASFCAACRHPTTATASQADPTHGQPTSAAPYPPRAPPYPGYAPSAPAFGGTPASAPPYPIAVAPVPPKRRRVGLIAGIAGGAVAVVAIGAGAFALTGALGSSNAGDSLWLQYFVPARV